MVFALQSSLNHLPIKSRGPIKENEPLKIRLPYTSKRQAINSLQGRRNAREGVGLYYTNLGLERQQA